MNKMIGLIAAFFMAGMLILVPSPAHADPGPIHQGPHCDGSTCPYTDMLIQTFYEPTANNSIDLNRITLTCYHGCDRLSGQGIKWNKVKVKGSSGALLWTSPEFSVYENGTVTLYPNVTMGKGARWFVDGVIDYKAGFMPFDYDQTYGDCGPVHTSGSTAHNGCAYLINF